MDVISILVKLRDDASAGLNKLSAVLAGVSRSGDKAGDSMGGLRGELGGVGAQADRTSGSLGRLNVDLRGLKLVLGLVSLQPLITGLVALGAQLTAVAASAVAAGAALGGALTAAAAQSIPAIGVLAAAFVRLGSVMDAVKAADQQQQSSAKDGVAVADQQRAAAEGVRSANEALADSHRTVTDSQKALTEARRAARRELTDTVQAEKAADLALRGSEKTVADATKSLREAIRTGGDVTQARLDLDQATLSRQNARIAERRSDVDTGRAVRSGAGGSERVIAAERQLEAALRGRARATRQVEAADRAAARAAASHGAASDKLAEALALLSPAERRLYESVRNLREEYKKAFRPVTDVIVDEFAGVSDRLGTLFQSSAFMGPFQALGDAIAGSIGDANKELLSGAGLKDFQTIVQQSADNTEIFSESLVNLVRLFERVAIAAEPLQRDLLERFAKWTGDLLESTDDSSGLDRFFATAGEHLDAWIDLAKAGGDLMLALSGPASESGKRTLELLTEQLRIAAEWIRDNPQKVDQFFRDTEKTLSIIAGLAWEITQALADLFDPESAEAFAGVLEEIFIPALKTAAEVTGELLKLFNTVTGIPIVGDIVKLTAQFAILAGVFGRMAKTLTALLGMGALKDLIGSRGGGGPDVVGGPAGKPGGGGLFGKVKTFAKGPGGRLLGGAGLVAGGLFGANALADRMDKDPFLDDKQPGFVDAVGRNTRNERLARDLAAAVKAGDVTKLRAIATAVEGIGKAFDRSGTGRQSAKELADAVKDINALADDISKTKAGRAIRDIEFEFFKLGKTSGATLGDLRDLVKSTMSDIRKRFSDDPKAAAQASSAAFRSARDTVLELMKDKRISVKTGMAEISRLMRREARIGGEGLAASFSGARDSIRDAMEDGVISTERGMKKIRGLLRQELRHYGIDWSDAQIRNYVRKGDVDIQGKNSRAAAEGTGGGATGWVGMPGERGKDEISAKIGRGEFVGNWAHAKYIEPALQNTYGHGLGEMFQRVRGYHAGSYRDNPWQLSGFSGGYAGKTPSGGTTVPVPGFPGEFIRREVAAFAASYARRFRMLLTDGFATAGHTGAGHLSVGNAADFVPGQGGSWDLVDRAAAFAASNRNRFGSVLYDGRFGTTAYPNHGRNEHLHVEFNLGAKGARALPEGTMAGRPRDARVSIPRIGTTGVGGILQRIAESALEATRQGARVAGQTVVDSGDAVDAAPTGGGRLGKAAIKGLWRRAGGSPNMANLMSAIALAESGGRPRVVNSIGATGLWQVMQSVWGKVFPNLDFRKPLDNAKAAVSILKRQGLGAWEAYTKGMHTKYLASGGFGVPGARGQGVPALLHGTEWVLDDPQKHALSKMLGTGVGDLGMRLGMNRPKFGSSFEGGGNVAQIVSGVRGVPASLRKMGMDDPLWLLQEAIAGISEVAKTVRDQARRSVPAAVRSAKRANDALGTLTGEGGAIAKIAEGIERVSLEARRKLQAGTFTAIGAGRFRRRGGGELADATGELDITMQERSLLVSQRTAVRNASRATEAQIRRVQRDLGQKGLSSTRKQALARTLEELQGKDSELAKTFDELEGGIIDATQRIVEQQEAVQEAAANATNTAAGRRGGKIDLTRRMLSAFGIAGGENGLIDQQVSSIRTQTSELRTVMAQAQRTGNAKLAAELGEQIEDLDVQIVELTQQKLANAAEAINSDASRGLAANDIAQRLANLRGPNFAATESLLGSRGGILSTQFSAASTLRDQAAAAGNQGLVRQLNQQLAELELAMAENTLAIEANTDAAMQARIDAITRPAAFAGSIASGSNGILGLISQITGADTSGSQIGILQGLGTKLAGAAQALRAELFSQFGLDFRGLAGGDLTAALSRVDFAALTSTLSEPDRQRFESLVEAIVGNESALLQNTSSIRDLEGQLGRPQSFSSTAWQLFRQAVFNGAGSLMPRYQIPQMHTGGVVPHSGLYNLAVGERVTRAGGQAPGGNVYVEVNEAGGDVDYNYLAGRVAFATRVPGT